MKIMITNLLAAILLAGTLANAEPAEGWASGNLTIKHKGVAHQVILKDRETGKYNSNAARGYCRGKGHLNGGDATGSYGEGSGPYVWIDSNGKVVESFPVKDNDGRFTVLVQTFCHSRY